MNKVCLGTVQFGLNYGINNKSGKPSKEQVFEIVETALSNGIDCFDTAAAYGNSEELIGEYFSTRKFPDNIMIVSKLRPNIDDDSDVKNIIISEIHSSLSKLRIASLDGFLLHNQDHLYNDYIVRALLESKKLGLVRNIGVSIYDCRHALDVVNSGIFDFVQVPYNILDRRLDRADFFNIAKQSGVRVFARSVFLQGLILMDNNKIPHYLSGVKQYLAEFDDIIRKYNLSRAEAALLFAMNKRGIDYIVLGVDNKEHLQEIIKITKKQGEFDNCFIELEKMFHNIDEKLISPNMWVK